MSKIEKAAVGAVKNYVDSCPRLDSIINENDKTPFWDGDIFVYKSKSLTNVNFYGRVPVQVKGRSDSTYVFRIKREEALAYKVDRGCIFFKVIINEDSSGSFFPSKILYAMLSSDNIDTLMKQTTKLIKIDLCEVPSNLYDFEEKVFQFVAKRNREKLENTSPKEIQSLVEQFEIIRKRLKDIKEPGARLKIKSYLDSITSLREDTREDDTIGWRDSFIYYSKEVLDMTMNNIEDYDFLSLQHNFGLYLYKQKQFHLVESYYQNVLEGYRKLSEMNPDAYLGEIALLLNDMAALHLELDRYEEGEKELMEALEIQKNQNKGITDICDLYYAHTLNNLASLHHCINRFEDAEKEYKEALVIYRSCIETNLEGKNEYVALTLNNLADLHSCQNRYDDAEREYMEALSIRRNIVNTDPNENKCNIADILNHMSNLHSDLRQYDKAEKELEEALSIIMPLADDNPSAYNVFVADFYCNLASLHCNLLKYEIAEKEFLKALRIYWDLSKSNKDAYIPYVAKTLNNYANLLFNLNDYIRAEMNFKAAMVIYKDLSKTYPAVYSSELAMTLINLAGVHCAINRNCEAEKEAKVALRIFKKLAKTTPKAYSWKVALTLENIARLLQKDANRREEAIKAAEEACIIYSSLYKENPKKWRKELRSANLLLAILKP